MIDNGCAVSIPAHKSMAARGLSQAGFKVSLEMVNGEPIGFLVGGLEPWRVELIRHFSEQQPVDSTVEAMSKSFWETARTVDPVTVAAYEEKKKGVVKFGATEA